MTGLELVGSIGQAASERLPHAVHAVGISEMNYKKTHRIRSFRWVGRGGPSMGSGGSKIRDEIDIAIRLRDKVLLILSEHSIKSDWVEDEVDAAYEEERKRGQTVLFPIRLDDTVIDTNKAWAAKLRRARHIGDFRSWKIHNDYKESFDRVLRDLKAAPKVTCAHY